MAEPLVSVVIPTHNRAGLVGGAIDSILEQSYPAVELIVVDDGSTDQTAEVVGAYGARLRYVAQENAGPAAARNHGIRLAGGKYVAFLDSDDLWLPDKLSKQVALLEQFDESVPCCLCNSRLQGYGKSGTTSFELARLEPPMDQGLWSNVLEILLDRFVLFNQAVMVRRSVLERLEGFNQSLWVMEDHDLALRLALTGPWAYIAEPLVIWQCGSEDSLSNTVKRNPVRFQEANRTIYENLLKQIGPDDGPVYRKVRKLFRRANANLRIAHMLEHRRRWPQIVGRALHTFSWYGERLRKKLQASAVMQVGAS